MGIYTQSRPWGCALLNYRCFCCGSGMRLSNHHIVSREDGGSDDRRNKVTLCAPCHDALEGKEWKHILARKEEIKMRFKRCAAVSDSEHTPTYVAPKDRVYINPRTGKGWTDEEEAAFADIMQSGKLERIKPIQLFRRCGSNRAKALGVALEYGVLAARYAAQVQTRKKNAQNTGLASLASNMGRVVHFPEHAHGSCHILGHRAAHIGAVSINFRQNGGRHVIKP